jgi:hypothetical protein
MAALHWRHRLEAPALESVNDLAQLEQIVESGETVQVCIFSSRKRQPALPGGVEVCPVRRNKRAAAVGQYHKQPEHAAALDAADDRQASPFECVPLASNGHRYRKITVTGSLWPFPSTTSAMTG